MKKVLPDPGPWQPALTQLYRERHQCS